MACTETNLDFIEFVLFPGPDTERQVEAHDGDHGGEHDRVAAQIQERRVVQVDAVHRNDHAAAETRQVVTAAVETLPGTQRNDLQQMTLLFCRTCITTQCLIVVYLSTFFCVTGDFIPESACCNEGDITWQPELDQTSCAVFHQRHCW